MMFLFIWESEVVSLKYLKHQLSLVLRKLSEGVCFLAILYRLYVTFFAWFCILYA